MAVKGYAASHVGYSGESGRVVLETLGVMVHTPSLELFGCLAPKRLGFYKSLRRFGVGSHNKPGSWSALPVLSLHPLRERACRWVVGDTQRNFFVWGKGREWFWRRSAAEVHAPSLGEKKRIEESSFRGFYKTRRGFYLNVSRFYYRRCRCYLTATLLYMKVSASYMNLKKKITACV